MANKNLREIFQVISEGIELGDDFKIEDIPELELPENFNDAFFEKYLTIEAAQNDPRLRSHYKGKYLSSIDLKIKNGFIQNGGTEEKFNELKAKEPDSLKLADLIFNEVKNSKSIAKPNEKPDKAFEDYKKETIKQIEDLKRDLENKDSEFSTKLQNSNSDWENRFRKSKVNELLSGIKFDSSIPDEDLKMIINSKLDQSNYLIKMDEGKFKVYKKDDPDALALKDGKELQFNEVITELSQPYIAKNDQVRKPENRRVEVPANGTGTEDGRFIPGHKDYGKI